MKAGHWLGLAFAVLLASEEAAALMAGSAPDTPAARVDANVVSSPWTSAVSVLVNGNAYSGVVVAPRHVLTAAHVTDGMQPAAVSVQLNAQSTPVLRSATAITRFPSASFPYDDLALITLDAEVPPEIEIPRIHAQALTGPVTITLVGYGASARGDTGSFQPATAGVKRSGRNSVDTVQTSIDTSGRTSLFYLFDFDGPNGNGSFGGPTLGNALETSLGSGDSGSPAYLEVDGERRLLGIGTFVAAAPGAPSVDYRFGTRAGGMLLSDPRFIDWLTVQTDNTLGPRPNDADVPLPLWSVASLGVLLCASAASSRRLAA